MRPLVLSLLAAVLVLPAAALAGARAAGDGTLVVRDANGKVTVKGRGTIFGHFDHGSMTIVDYKPDDGVDPQVNGAQQTVPGSSDGIWLYKGNDVRFRFFGGRYTIRLAGSGIDVSAVGRGVANISGQGTVDDGDFAVDGRKFMPVSSLLTVAPFGATGTP
jgi:hypothetical protein